jgi:exopolyphosphatase/guanosine-5'-triphosphate,3'-diphosphate pyrophosphatase
LRLLVADVGDHAVVDVTRRMEIVRLGEGVDRTGRLSDAALDRAFAVLDDYAQAVRSLDVTAIRMVATSATRDAANREVFVAGVQERLGVEPEVISGDEEAALSFAGATAELVGTRRLESPYLVLDIGGGSTEFVLGDGRRVLAAKSVDIGCVRLTERHLRDDPPTTEQIAAATKDVEAAFDEVQRRVDVASARTLVGLAGSVTTVAALVLGLAEYNPARIHHAQVSASDVAAVTTRLLAATAAERAAMPVMHPGRVDVIGGGALVLHLVMQRFGFDAVVASEHDILDGIALSLG